MILVTIGMNDSPYVPLFEAMDRLVPKLNEKVIQQIGSLQFTGKNSECFTYLPDTEMSEIFDSASLIVCHAGIGTILNGLKRNIPLVLVPRNIIDPSVEHDQQMIVARKIESMGRGVIVNDLTELETKIEEARNLKMEPYVPDNKLCCFLTNLFKKLNSHSGERRYEGHHTSGRIGYALISINNCNI